MRRLKNMCTKIPNNPLEERSRWVLPIIRKEVRLREAAMIFPGEKRTLERWVSIYKKQGKNGLIPRSTRPKSQANETLRLKEKIIEMRKEKKSLCLKTMV